MKRTAAAIVLAVVAIGAAVAVVALMPQDQAKTFEGRPCAGSECLEAARTTTTVAATTTTAAATTTTTNVATATTPTASTGGSVRILIVGPSQTMNWARFLPDATTPGVGEWDLVWKSGAGDAWSRQQRGQPRSALWSTYDYANHTGPVIVTFSSSKTSAEWQEAFAALVENFSVEAPNHGTIFLQPIVGEASHSTTACSSTGQERSPRNHALMWPEMQSFAAVTDGVEAIYHPHITACEDYRDDLGHLADNGIGEALAAEVIVVYGDVSS